MRLLLGDCLSHLKGIASNSIDLVVTSPPYDDIRNYQGTLGWDFSSIAAQLFRVIKSGGVLVWIISDQTKDGSESGTSFSHCLAFRDLGFLIHDTMIWKKHCSPFQHKNRYIQAFEYMFVLSKGKPKTANLIKDRKNKWAGTRVHGTERQVSGSIKPMSEVQKSKFVKEFGARENVWEIFQEKKNKTGHPAVFPIRIAEDHIRSWSNPGEIVMDPFMGSGTTGLACASLGRQFIGIEINPEYFEIAKQRLGK